MATIAELLASSLNALKQVQRGEDFTIIIFSSPSLRAGMWLPTQGQRRATVRHGMLRFGALLPGMQMNATAMNGVYLPNNRCRYIQVPPSYRTKFL